MIKIGTTDLSTYGLYVKPSGYNGLFDFPGLKKIGIDWKDNDYLEQSNRHIDYNFESKLITLDCFVIASTWSVLKSRLSSIASALSFDDLKMLSCEQVSNRGYMVYLSKTTLAEPYYYLRNGKCIADVKLIFNEPQPYNFQVHWDAREEGKAVSITISKGSKTLNTESNKQRHITVWWNDTKTEINLEQADFTLSTSVSSGLYPLVVTGEIDDIETVQINSAASGVSEAAFYLRNGTLTIV